MTVGEINYHNDEDEGPYYEYSLGAWMYSSEFDEIEDPAKTGTGNSGIYVSAERQIFMENETSDQGLAVFTRFGIANTTYNQIGKYLGFGGAYKGIISGRDNDLLGVAIALAMNGDSYKESMVQAGSAADDSETNIELIYSAEISPWLDMQADLQYVINPGTNPDLDNALGVGIRFSFSF